MMKQSKDMKASEELPTVSMGTRRLFRAFGLFVLYDKLRAIMWTKFVRIRSNIEVSLSLVLLTLTTIMIIK